MRDIEKRYARAFATDDGRAVLAHLKSITLMRALPADADEQTLRHLEGQRALVLTLIRLIENGKS